MLDSVLSTVVCAYAGGVQRHQTLLSDGPGTRVVRVGFEPQGIRERTKGSCCIFFLLLFFLLFDFDELVR